MCVWVRQKESEDDLYEGFNNPAFKPQVQYNNFENAASAPGQLGSVLGKPGAPGRLGTSSRLGTSNRMGTSRLGTAARGGEEARPMTSIRAAGYSSSGRVGTSAGLNSFAGSQAQGPAPPLEVKTSNTPEDVARELEREVNELLEESATANAGNRAPAALDRAKMAAQKERKLGKHREQHNLMDQMNIDLTYAVCFNLATQFEANEMYPEALNTYSLIVKDKQYVQSGRLRVNMGNIYFKQKPPRYPTAIKMYRMALDQIPVSGKELRFKIMRNIAHAFVKMGNYKDAQKAYEEIMESQEKDKRDLQVGFNLLVCYYALGETLKMRECFSKMLDIKTTDIGVRISEDDQDRDDGDATEEEEGDDEDEIRKVEKESRAAAKALILQAAKLIAPQIVKQDPPRGGKFDVEKGFNTVIEMLNDKGYMDVAEDMRISMAVWFLKQDNAKQAKATLEYFEKKLKSDKLGESQSLEERMENFTAEQKSTLSRAYTNLCFIYFLEGVITKQNDDKTADRQNLSIYPSIYLSIYLYVCVCTYVSYRSIHITTRLSTGKPKLNPKP